MAGLWCIVIVALVAIAGPLIRPDSTPKANQQVLEIKIKPAGFSVQMLKVRKNDDKPQKNFFTRFFKGTENQYKLMPIYDYGFFGSDIIVEKYTGDKVNNGEKIKINIADVVYPIDYTESYEETTDNGMISFTTFSGEKVTKSITELQKMIVEDNIYTQKYYLGTDQYGRDILSRLMAGAWISLLVGFIAVFISLVIGITMGAIAGYFKGWIDDLIMWIINVVWSIPTLLLVIAITLAIGKDFWQVFIAVGLTMWVEVARVVRGQVIGLREMEFIEAGNALGFKSPRIIFRHILPNVMGPVIVISASNFASAILIEAGLSFLGLGAPPPQATWGKMINELRGYITTGHALLPILPGLCIMAMVLSFVLLGNGLRDALDTRSVEDLESKP